MILLIAFAFLSGLVTIFAPCIWPILPVVLSSGSTSTDHRRPLGLVIGISVSFALITLSLSTLVRFFHFDPNLLRIFAVIVIASMGLSLVIPQLTHWSEMILSRLSGSWKITTNNPGHNFLAGLITGSSLGIVWSPCAGPILATIAALSATGAVTLSVISITLAYSFGVAVPLFILVYGSQKILAKSRLIAPYTHRLQQVFGIIMIITAILIFTNTDKTLELSLLNSFPQLTSSLNGFESNAQVTLQLNQLRGRTPTNNSAPLFDTTAVPAPDFVGITKWQNTPSPLTLKDLKGKVVLVDFWTYTCINCLRTLPHITAWYDKYKLQGFVVIGVHTPEFEFEKNPANVAAAIKQFNIHYPVAQDNDYATWNNYNNQYWPAEYLIDAQGNIRKSHFGEGNYQDMEASIQSLLRENNQQVNSSLVSLPNLSPQTQISPESYLGARRAQYFYPTGTLSSAQQSFTLATDLPPNTFSFGGSWNITDNYAATTSNSQLEYHFTASKVYVVLRPGNNKDASVKVFLDDHLVNTISIDSSKLYPLINSPGAPSARLLRLEFSSPGIEAYAFTFG